MNDEVQVVKTFVTTEKYLKEGDTIIVELGAPFGTEYYEVISVEKLKSRGWDFVLRDGVAWGQVSYIRSITARRKE